MMEAELTRALDKVERKKHALDIETDLTRECQAIQELDHRAELMQNGAKNLKTLIDDDCAFLKQICDDLNLAYSKLNVSVSVADLIDAMITMHNLWRLMNQDSEFKSLLEGDYNVELIQHNNYDGGPDRLKTLLTSFDDVYRRYEQTFSARSDLPYSKMISSVRGCRSKLAR